MDDNYSEAFYEVLEVLKYVPREEYDKIPRTFIKVLQDNYDESSTFEYNLALPFEEQDISEEAKIILAIICEKYWNKVFEQGNSTVVNENVKALIQTSEIKDKNILFKLIYKIKKLFAK